MPPRPIPQGTTEPSKSLKTVRMPGPGLHNANTKGGSLSLQRPNSGPAKVLPKR